VLTFVFALLFSFTSNAEQIGRFDGTLYYNKGTITVFWNPSTNATYYEVIGTWMHPSNASYDIEYNYGTTSATTLVLVQRRAGFFKFKVRACNNNHCSPYSESVDITKSVCSGVPCKWICYWILPAPIIVVQ